VTRNVYRATMMALTVLIATALAGCGQREEAPAPAAQAPAAQPQAPAAVDEKPRAAPTLVLTEADADRALRLERGQVVEVRLEADRVAGYTWIPPHDVRPVMSTDGMPAFEPDPDQPASAPGTEIWRFIALEPGHAHLVFEYLRPFDGGAPPQRSVTYHFDVE
jgi:predicted secreted protein